MSTTKTIDLQAFCGKPPPVSALHDMTTPFVRDGWRYATNGIILLRVPAPDEPDSPDDNRPDVRSVMEREIPRTPMERWPEDGLIEGREDCPDCNGDGKVDTLLCEQCGGNGQHVCPTCGNEDDCEECEGRGTTKGKICPKCGGSGIFKGPLYRTLAGGRKVRADMDALVRSLPDVRYCPDGEPRAAVYFVFDGGEGLVMPYRPDGYR